MKFFRRYTVIMIVTVILVFFITLGFFYLQYQSRYESELNTLKGQFEQRALTLDYAIESASDTVDGMQVSSQLYLTTHQTPEKSALFAYIQDAPAEKRFHLDNFQPPFQAELIGNLTGYGSITQRSPDYYREVEMALALNPSFQIAKYHIPNLAWAYYISANKFMNLYPWVASSEVTLSDDVYQQAFYTLALPENNPKRHLFWSPAYIDVAGKGLMVTCSAPVYEGDTFRGVVAVDYTLDILNSFVTDFPFAEAHLFIVNEQNQLLADSTLVRSTDKEVKMAELALPESLQHEKLFDLKPLVIHDLGDDLFIYQPLENVPWKLVLWVPKTAINSEIATADFFFLLLILVVMLGVTNYLTYREFILPAEKLVTHIQNQARGIHTPMPFVPASWQPWFKTISTTFGHNRALIEQLNAQTKTLQASETRVRTIIDATVDSIIIMTDDGTIDQLNPATETLFGYHASELIGQNIHRLLPLPIHDVYDSAFVSANVPLVRKFSELVGQSKDGATLPLEVNVSEMTLGDQRFLIGVLRNIAERKQAEEERLKLSVIQQELSIAQGIQNGLLPPSRPDWPGLEVICFSLPATQVGGDFYKYHQFSDLTKYAFAIGDVSGKGVSAALLMATSLSQFDASLSLNFTATERMAHLDEAILPYTKPKKQNCAMCYVELEVKDRPGNRHEAHIINAGCIPPYLRRANGEVVFREVTGFALGQGLGATLGYEAHTIELAEGDILIMVSDGVIEAHNELRQILGFDGLFKLIQAAPATTVEAMLDYLKGEIITFMGAAEQHDDITIIVARV